MSSGNSPCSLIHGSSFSILRKKIRQIVSFRDKRSGLWLCLSLLFFIENPLFAAETKVTEPNKSKLVDQAQTQFNQGKWDDVVGLLWPQIDSLDRRGLLLLAQAHVKKKEAPEVLKVARLLVSRDEKDEEAHTLMGWAQLEKGDEKGALDSYKKATEFNSNYQPAYQGLIKIYEKRKNLYELRILYQDMTEKFGAKPEFLSRLCAINTEDGLNDAAQEVCSKAILKSPNTAENYVHMGLIYKNRGENAGANTKLKSAADKFPQSAFAQETYGIYVAEKSDSISAYRYFSNCLKIEANNEKCLAGHGVAAATLQKFDESYNSLKKLCEKDRKHTITVRKVVQNIRNAKKSPELGRFESLADKCLSP